MPAAQLQPAAQTIDSNLGATIAIVEEQALVKTITCIHMQPFEAINQGVDGNFEL